MELLLDSLAAYLSGSADPILIRKLSKLIRLSPKEFPDADVVLPPLQVWKKCLDSEELSVENFEALMLSDNDSLAKINKSVASCWKFCNVILQNEKVLLKMDRPFVMNNLLQKILKEGHTFESTMTTTDRKTVRIVNCELSLSDHQSTVFSQLSEVRCNQVWPLKFYFIKLKLLFTN